ncbi:MAG: hypothetical protein JW983_00540 [Elusimicrobia bacterium]|nr:hypothetical protein [Elusimicrobiota bacterium]
MKRIILIISIFLVLISSVPFVLGEEFDMDEWQKLRGQKEKKIFTDEKIETALPGTLHISSAPAVPEPTVPAILSEGIDLPYESKLAISGRKYIGMKYKTSKYLNEREDGKLAPSPSGFELNQQLQVRVKGTVKRKITVNVDYDDTVENKKDISIQYKGDPDEIVQEAAFGDVTLSLPGTEFVSYNKAAFGATTKLKYKRANAYAIFSRTKGTTETKRFTGSTTFEKEDINDTSYLRRKYYKLALDPSHLPIKPGSEKIYIDDKNAANNTIVTSSITVAQYNVWGSSVQATAELLYAGSDYTIDYERGVIVFRKTIEANYIIAVDYEKKDGTRVINDAPGGLYKMIKDESDNLQYELKNYYSIGRRKIVRDDNKGNFILQILDLNRKEVTRIDETAQNVNYPEYVEVDFEAGTFRFTDGTGNDAEPFPAATYAKSPTRSHIIYLEYRYRAKSYLVKPNIVPHSEKIMMNNKMLIRDVDYFIDYDSGFITFLNEEKITDSTVIEITYEWTPFGGQLDQTVVGFRGEYAPFDNFGFGSTFLYNFPAKPQTAPSVRSTPESIAVYEFDSRASFKNLPLQPSISGEYAGSVKNPNTYGNALIENMEGIKMISSMAINKLSWKYSANIAADVTEYDSLYWENVDVQNGIINPSVPEGERETNRQVLNIAYKLQTGKETSIIYSISRLGADYTKKLFLEVWMYGDGSGDDVTLSIGSLNEDADGDGVLDTEDLNSDGILNSGEDVGISFNHPSGVVTTIGSANGRIDTEDLDGDGILRRNDNILGSFGIANFVNSDGSLGFIDESGNQYTSISWTGWKHFILPLGDVSSWEAVKQVRITVKSTSGSSVYRNIQFAEISLVGNKWEKPVVTGTGINDKMTATAINNVDNTGYIPLYSYFPSLYEDLYNLDSNDLIDKKEQSLLLQYTLINGSKASTKVVFSRAEDYSKHRKLTYFLWGDDSKGATFKIQFGAESAYFEHTITPNWTGWGKIVLELIDINNDNMPDIMTYNNHQITQVGTPSLTNIAQIKIVVENNSGLDIEDGKIWVDELYVDDAWKVKGYAHRENADFTIPEWATFGGKYKYIDRNFQTLTTQIANRDYEEKSGYFKMPQIWFLKPSIFNWISVPLDTSVSKTLTITPSSVQTGDPNLVSILDEGRVVNVSGNSSTSVSIKKFPQLGASYSKSITETKNLSQRDESNSYSGNLSYTNPLKLYVTPNSLSASYSRTDSYRGYPEEEETDFKDLFSNITTWYLLTYTKDYSGQVSFTPLGWMETWVGIIPFSNLSLSPNYKYTITREEKLLSDDKITCYPKNDSQTASVSSSFRIFSWFQPSASYSSGITQTYDLTASTYTGTDWDRLIQVTTGQIDAETKSVSRTASGDVSVSLIPKNIVKFKPINSLSLNASYSISDGDSYEKVSSSLTSRTDVYKELWVRKSIPLESPAAKRKSLTLSDTVRGNARWSPFEFIKFPSRLTPIGNITTSSAYSKSDRREETTGTVSKTITKNWPDITAGMPGTEKFLYYIGKYVSDTHINVKYTKRTTDVYASTEQVKSDWTVSNSYDYRFNVIRKFDCFSSYSVSTNFSEDLRLNKVTADGKAQSASGQIGYRWRDWRLTPRFDWTKSVELDGEGKFINDTLGRTYSLGINYDVSKPILWKIPFTSTILELKNRFTATSNLKYTRNHDRVEDKNNTDTYTMSMSGDYTISDNLRMNIGSSGTYYKCRTLKQDDYYSLEISSALTITF